MKSSAAGMLEIATDVMDDASVFFGGSGCFFGGWITMVISWSWAGCGSTDGFIVIRLIADCVCPGGGCCCFDVVATDELAGVFVSGVVGCVFLSLLVFCGVTGVFSGICGCFVVDT